MLFEKAFIVDGLIYFVTGVGPNFWLMTAWLLPGTRVIIVPVSKALRHQPRSIILFLQPLSGQCCIYLLLLASLITNAIPQMPCRQLVNTGRGLVCLFTKKQWVPRLWLTKFQKMKFCCWLKCDPIWTLIWSHIHAQNFKVILKWGIEDILHYIFPILDSLYSQISWIPPQKLLHSFFSFGDLRNWQSEAKGQILDLVWQIPGLT